MNKQRWGIAATCAGLAILILSFAWSSVVPGKLFWNDEDQQVFDQARERDHQAGHRLERARQSASATEQSAAQAELESAKQQLDAETARFQNAHSRLTQIPRILFWLGLMVLAAGLYMLVR